MLINFRAKNSRSFYDEINMSMQAAPDDTLSDINTFKVADSLLPNSEVLKSALIFGSNASGKSNVIKCFAYMVNAIKYSSIHFPIIRMNEPFAFLDKASDEESLYEAEFIQSSIYYKYGFSILKGKVVREWLYKRNERLTPLFNRDGDFLKISGVKASVVKMLNIPEDALFLSVANNFKLPIRSNVQDALDWFNNVLIVFENNYNSFDIYSSENDKYRKRAMDILSRADIGITDFEVVKDKVAEKSIGITDFEVVKDKVAEKSDINVVLGANTQIQIAPNQAMSQIKADNEGIFNIDLKTSFNVYDSDSNIVGKKDVMLLKEHGFNSEGTERLFFYLGWLLAALDSGRVILVDELDSKLHFLIADYLLGLFNSIDKNPNNSQLIATVHNVMLMDDNLRRDQIYFTSKDSVGKSNLTSLADYKNVRKTDLFSKKYLAGFYSRLPDMSV